MVFKHSWLALILHGALWLPALGCGESASPPPTKEQADKSPPLTPQTEEGTITSPAPK
jgi:hypothetical protein